MSCSLCTFCVQTCADATAYMVGRLLVVVGEQKLHRVLSVGVYGMAIVQSPISLPSGHWTVIAWIM